MLARVPMGSWEAPTLQEKTNVYLGLGVLAGLYIGYEGFKHFFVEGVTSEEKKNILLFSASMGVWWGLNQAFDLDKRMVEWQNQAAQAVGLQTGVGP